MADENVQQEPPLVEDVSDSRRATTPSLRQKLVSAMNSPTGVIAAVLVAFTLGSQVFGGISWIVERVRGGASTNDIAVTSELVPITNVRDSGVDYVLPYGASLPNLEGHHGYCTPADSEALTATGTRLGDILKIIIQNTYEGNKDGNVLLTNFRAEVVDRLPSLQGVKFSCPTGGLDGLILMDIDLERSLTAKLSHTGDGGMENFAPSISLQPGEISEVHFEFHASIDYKINVLADLIVEGRHETVELTDSPVTVHSDHAISDVSLSLSPMHVPHRTNLLICSAGERQVNCPMISIFTEADEQDLIDMISDS